MNGTRTKILLGALAASLFFALGAIPEPGRKQMPPGPQPTGAGAGIDMAKAPKATTSAPEAAQAITSETALVNVDVLAVDEDGVVLGGLKKENFRLLDNGKPQIITNFSPVTAPITIAVLMEYNSSSYNYFSAKAVDWGSLFINRLEPLDYVALVTYDLKPTVRADFTRNKAEVRDTLYTLGYPNFREANLFDSLLDTLDRLERIKGRKAMLILSTGANTFSSYTLNNVLDRLRRTDVTIFCVGLAEAEYLNYGDGFGYLQDKNQLDTFADQTGGIAYFPRFQGELPSIFSSVAAILRSQYTLGFTPEIAARDGKYHKLQIQIVGADGKPLIVTNKQGKKRKVVVTARRGYVAPKNEIDPGGN